MANPIIAGLFFLTFLSVWRRQRERSYVLAWSLVYLAASIGWSIDFFRVVFDDMWVSLGANAAFPFVALFTTRGACLRYAGRSPDRALIAIYAVAVGLSSFLCLAHGSIAWRGTAISWGMAVMLLIALIAVLRAKERDNIDNSIALVLGLVTIVLMIRPAVSVLVEGAPSDAGARPESFWIVSSKLMALFSWISFAILFLIRIAADLMSDLAEQSVTDPLSGVLNRRGLFERAKPMLERATSKMPASVIVCDIDRFKKINDTHGHSTGDAVIQDLARVLRQVVGELGIVGRMGGEEFAVILSADARTALLLAEGIRTAFSHRGSTAEASLPAATVSIGLAQTHGGESLDLVLGRADAALYAAKRGGRDRVECAFLLQDTAINAAA